MKPFVVLSAFVLVAGAVSAAAQPLKSAMPIRSTQISSNEQAGLPNLDTINGTVMQNASASAKVEFNTPRQPSFYHREANGTVIKEYRNRGKPTQINVQSNFGVRYQMSAPADTSPRVQNQDVPSTRLPSVNIPY